MAEASLYFNFESDIDEEAARIRAQLASLQTSLQQASSQMGQALVPRDQTYVRNFLAQIENLSAQARQRLGGLGERFGESIRGGTGKVEGQTFRQAATQSAEELRTQLTRSSEQFLQGLSPELRAALPDAQRIATNAVNESLESFNRLYTGMTQEFNRQTSGRLQRQFARTELPLQQADITAQPAPLGTPEYEQAQRRYAAQGPVFGPATEELRRAGPSTAELRQAGRRGAEQISEGVEEAFDRSVYLSTDELQRQIDANLTRTGAARDPRGARFLRGNLAQGPEGELYRYGRFQGFAQPLYPGAPTGEETPPVTAAEVSNAQRQRAQQYAREAKAEARAHERVLREQEKVAQARREQAAQIRAQSRAEARRQRVLEGLQTGAYRRVSGSVYEQVQTGRYRDISRAALGAEVPYTDPRIVAARAREAEQQRRQLQRQQAQRQRQQRPSGLDLLLGEGRGGLGAEGFAGTTRGLVRYAAASAAIYGLSQVIRDTKNETVDFRDSLTDLEVALGRGEAVSNEYVDTLERFSRLAGSNVGAALDAAARGVRAFGDAQTQSREELEALGAETAEQANVLAVIAGKPLQDATGDLIAIRSSFGTQATTLAEINEAIAAAKQLGGDPNQTAQGLANAASAFNEAGFDLREAAGIISVINARLDQTGQRTATRLSRIFQIARGGPAQAALQSVGIVGGTVEEQFAQLARLEQQGALTEQQMEGVIEAIAGTANLREATTLIRNYAEVQEFTNETLLNGGAAADEYARKSNDLAGLFRKISGDISNIQVNFAESGALAPIGLLLEGLEPALRLLNSLLNLLNEIPGAIRTPLILIGEFAGAIALINRFGGRFEGLARLIQPIGGARQAAGAGAAAAAQTREAQATARNTALQRQQIAVRQQLYSAVSRGLIPQQQATQLLVADTIATERNNRSRLRNLTLRARASLAERTAPTRALVGGAAGFARSPVGLFTGGLIAASVIAEVEDSFRAMIDANEDAAEAVGEMAAAGGSVDQLKDSVQALTEAANAAREASGGVVSSLIRGATTRRPTGTLGLPERYDQESMTDFLASLLGRSLGRQAGIQEPTGVDPMAQAESMDNAARITLERTEELEENLAALGASAGVFGGAIESSEDLAAGLEQLEANGAVATDVIAALDAAIGDLAGGTSEVGTILPGGGLQFANELAGEIIADIEAGFADAGGLVAQGGFGDRLLDILGGTLGGLPLQDLFGSDLLGFDMAELDAERERLTEELEEVERQASRGRTGEVRAAARERVDEIRGRLDALDDAAASIDEQVQARLQNIPELADPEAQAALQTQVVDTVRDYLESQGLEGGGVLDEAQREELAGLLTDQLSDVPEEIREAVASGIVESIEALTTREYAALDAQTQRELQAAYVKFAPQVEEFALLDNEGPRAAAQRRVDALQGIIDEVEATGQEPINSLVYALKEAERNLLETTNAIAASQRELARSLLAPGDEIGRLASEFEDISALWRDAQARGDEEEANRRQAELNENARQQAEARRERASRAAEAEVAPGAEMAAADLRLEQAAAELERLRRERYDSEGRQTAEYSEALIEYREAQYENAQLEREAAQAERLAALDPADELGRARVELDGLRDQLEVVEYDSAEYWSIFGEIQSGKRDVARLEREAIEAARDAARDPRDDVQAARDELVDLIAERNLLPAGAERDRVQAQINRARLQAGELERRRRQSRRTAAIDPRDEVANARDALRRAQEDLAAASPAQSDYGDLQRAVADARLAYAQAERDQAAAARRADNYPGSQLQDAADDLADARDALEAALPGTAAFYDALGGLRQAEVAYAQAAAEAAANRRLLGQDISDPLVQARDELQRARDARRTAAAQGAPRDVLDELLLEERQAELNAERVAFDERMRAAQTANDLGRMSHAAYLQYLEDEAARLRAISDRTYQQQEMLDEVDRAIQAANDQMSGQWNLGDIDVPTVYEVRRSMEAQRLGQSAAATTSEVVNNINISGADIAEVRRLVISLVGPAASSRTITGPRRN